MKKDNVISADNCQVSGIDEETLFVSKYPASESTLDDASELYGSVKLKSMSSALSLLMLVILILLAIALPDQILILGVGALTVALFSAFATNWARIQRKAVDASSLKKAVGSKCVVTLTDSHVRVVADGEEIDVFSLTDLKRVRANEIGCLADFGKKRIAYFQQKG